MTTAFIFFNVNVPFSFRAVPVQKIIQRVISASTAARRVLDVLVDVGFFKLLVVNK